MVLKDLGNAAPRDAETFQWFNLLRGDTMLMSLTNHRYLATEADSPGPVTATASGPNPARRGGVCFKWQEVSDAVSLSGRPIAAIGELDVLLKLDRRRKP